MRRGNADIPSMSRMARLVKRFNSQFFSFPVSALLVPSGTTLRAAFGWLSRSARFRSPVFRSFPQLLTLGLAPSLLPGFFRHPTRSSNVNAS